MNQSIRRTLDYRPRVLFDYLCVRCLIWYSSPLLDSELSRVVESSQFNSIRFNSSVAVNPTHSPLTPAQQRKSTTHTQYTHDNAHM